MSGQKHFILPTNASTKTFDNDEKLPSLPVPALELTIQRYLESVKPFADSDEEFQQTQKIAHDFLREEGAMLHSKLLQLAAKQRNWLERWWEDYAYLGLREPLVPHYNMSGSHPMVPGLQYRPGLQLKMAALYCYQLVNFWKLLREERLRPAMTGDKRPMSMDQFRKLFNCSIVPGMTKDSIKSCFKTEREGSCSSQVVVLSNGHMFMVDGEALSPIEWEHQLERVQRRTLMNRGTEVPYLACDYRTPWAQNRHRLAQLSEGNAIALSMVEEAMFVLSLDEATPDTQSAVNQLVLCGDYSCRWPDAATNIVVFSNGRSGGLCVHSAFDGIVSGTATLFASSGVQEDVDSWVVEATTLLPRPEPRHLDFLLDPYLQEEVQRVKREQQSEKQKFIIRTDEFNSFGKKRIQNLKVHPDSFIQMSLQLAYYRLHSKFAPCYETATTRTFYHGRTETVRSCTEDCVRWVHSMVDSEVKDSVCAKLLLKAIQRQNEMMSEASNGQGCDRHLLGLYCTAVEADLPLPALFLDPLFEKSGGGGNFILSTSLLGYSPTAGGVAPMCLHGYGIFYSITPESLFFTISVRRDSKETSACKMFSSISKALKDMTALLEAQAPAKL